MKGEHISLHMNDYFSRTLVSRNAKISDGR